MLIAHPTLALTLANPGLTLHQPYGHPNTSLICECCRWPFLDQYNFSDCIVSNPDMHTKLDAIWKELFAITSDNSMAPLVRPPPECDLRKDRWEEPTITWPPPILLDTGTSSYLDAAKIYKACKRDGQATKRVICGDMATFIRLWWLKAKFPSQYKDEVPWAGEFHGLAHLADGIVILNWTYILEPILLHFGVPGFNLKLNMKETSQRIR